MMSNYRYLKFKINDKDSGIKITERQLTTMDINGI